MKTCTKCLQQKDELHFYEIKNTGKRVARCTSCVSQQKKEFRRRRPESSKAAEARRKKKWGDKYPDRCRNTRLRCIYGITTDDYENMLKDQNGVCAICGCQEQKLNKHTGVPKRLAVDHCHTTGKVRGLLCFDCNSSIGKFKESIDNLTNAISYLKKHK